MLAYSLKAAFIQLMVGVMVSNIVYKFVSFADYSNLGYTKENVELLQSIFLSKGYVVSPVSEVDTLGNTFKAISMMGNYADPIINISSQRIEIIKGSDKKTGFDESEVVLLRKQMNDYMSEIYKVFEDIIQDANRMAWIAEYVYFDMEEGLMHKFRKKFMQTLDFYKNISTTEFVAKYAGLSRAKVLGNEEKINIITTIRRWFPGNGIGFVADVDGYGIEIDINTVASNKKNRFSTESFSGFIEEAEKIKRRIIGEVVDGCS